jgi:hypothetical protein
MTDDELIQAATQLAGEFRTSANCVAGGVAAALVTRSGKLYASIWAKQRGQTPLSHFAIG